MKISENKYLAYMDTLAILLDSYQESDLNRVTKCINDLRFDLKKDYIRGKK